MNLKLAFVNIQLQASSLKAGQNSLDMFYVLLKSFAKNQNIIHITKRSRILFPKTLWIKFLKEAGCISKFKWHDQVFIEASTCFECGVSFLFSCSTDFVKDCNNIKFGEVYNII